MSDPHATQTPQDLDQEVATGEQVVQWSIDDVSDWIFAVIAASNEKQEKDANLIAESLFELQVDGPTLLQLGETDIEKAVEEKSDG
jgi:hypothetical protein